MIIEIPPELEPISANAFYSGMHFSKRNKIADEWHLVIKSACRHLHPIMRCKLVFDFNTGYDLDNNSAMMKMIIDGIVLAGILPDDNKNHVKEITIRSSNKNRVTIIEL